MAESTFTLTLASDGRPGIVAAVTGAIANLGSDIAETGQFRDRTSGCFFLRLAFKTPNEALAATRSFLTPRVD